MVPSPHPNGGMLRVGNPGNRGGPGRPRDVVRAACLASFQSRIPVLEQIADGKYVQRIKVGEAETEAEVSASAAERIRAVEALGKIGMSSDAPAIIAAGSSDEHGTRFTLVIGDPDAL